MSGPFNLGSAELVQLLGPDSRAFAQAQFCSDVAALPALDWQWSAWLDANGRVRYFFALIDAGDNRLLAWLPLGDAAAFAQQLARFLFRSKVQVNALDGWAVRGDFNAPPESPRLGRDDESLRLLIAGAQPRLLCLHPADPADTVDPAALRRWRGCDAVDGLPLIDSACAGEFVPQALDLERWGAISFRKGCYPGQEVAARLHFRGGNKRGLGRLRWEGNSVLPAPGANLILADASTSIGTLLYSGGDELGAGGLAVLTNPEVLGRITIEPAICAQIEPFG